MCYIKNKVVNRNHYGVPSAQMQLYTNAMLNIKFSEFWAYTPTLDQKLVCFQYLNETNY